MTKIGDRLRKTREEKGLSQREVASAAGISQSTYSDLERGDNAGRSLEIFGQVAKGLGISADYLLDIEAETRPKTGKAVAQSGLTPPERDLLGMFRSIRSANRRSVLRIVQDMYEEEKAMRRNLALLEQIEELDTSGLFESSQKRLFELAAELGSLRAAFAALKAEVEVEKAPGEDASAQI